MSISHINRRQRQIELLLSGFPRARCLNPDNSMWEVPLDIGPGRELRVMM